MCQTSSPNGRDTAAIGRPLPFANSLATDFYELLPNDTDLTMLLPLGVDAGNYSIIGGGKRYHTPLDTLARLDRHSVRHMGATTLRSEEHTSELQSLMRISYAVFCLNTHINRPRTSKLSIKRHTL